MYSVEQNHYHFHFHQHFPIFIPFPAPTISISLSLFSPLHYIRRLCPAMIACTDAHGGRFAARPYTASSVGCRSLSASQPKTWSRARLPLPSRWRRASAHDRRRPCSVRPPARPTAAHWLDDHQRRPRVDRAAARVPPKLDMVRGSRLDRLFECLLA
jgi:hypothetical protein